MPESTCPPRTVDKFLDQFESGPHDWYKHDLRDSFPGLDDETVDPAVPAGHIQLPLVVGINEPDQVAQHDTVLVAQSGTRQQHRRQIWIGNVDR